MILDFQNWMQGVVDEFFADYGTTRFFSTPTEARAFVENNFSQNPRLDPIEIQILYDSSANAFDYALSQAGNDPQLAALIYWQEMQMYIALNTSDPQIQNVFDTGVQAAQDTYNITYDEDVKTKLDIPWYLLAIPVGLLFWKLS